jgi:hypothetical protein
VTLTKEQADRVIRVYNAWADAEEAAKIAEHAVGEAVIPAIMELRYAGRKLAKSLNNYLTGERLAEADRWLEDAINDCYRARHDATDAATAFIAVRLDAATRQYGPDEVRACFPGYPELRSLLAKTRQQIASARRDHNGRHDIYEQLERGSLPKIMELYESFVANEPDLSDRRFRKWLARQGINLGWVVALIVAVIAIFASL